MDALYQIIKDITLEDALEIERNDSMLLSLTKLYNALENKEFFLPLILANSLICYQLSSTWESYWEEFSTQATKYKYKKVDDIFLFLIDFLPKSEGNKRLVPTKLQRLKKLKNFLSEFFYEQKHYYKDMIKLQRNLAKEMKQGLSDKTIVFSVKMFWYGARIRFWETKIFPESIPIPLDSRLQNIYKKYRWDYNSASDFYHDLAKKVWIPQLHLDAVLWINYEAFMKNDA